MLNYFTISKLNSRSNNLGMIVFLLVVALISTSCGESDDSVVSQGDDNKRIRMIESETIFTKDDVNAIGWKDKKDFLLDYPGAIVARWGYLNTAEVGVLIYNSADEARTLGVAAADVQTAHNEDGEAPGDGTMDRTECSSAGWQMAVENLNTGPPKGLASYIDADAEEKTPPSQKLPCPVRVPTYNDYTVIGNMVMLCQGDDGKPFEPSTNCRELEGWLTK